jgi:hypothetical protein
MKFVKNAEREPIGLPLDGEHYIDDSLVEFQGRLISLKEMGYRFPDCLIEEIAEEINDEE